MALEESSTVSSLAPAATSSIELTVRSSPNAGGFGSRVYVYYPGLARVELPTTTGTAAAHTVKGQLLVTSKRAALVECGRRMEIESINGYNYKKREN